MTEIISGVRAKAGFIRTRRFNKAGKIVESLDHGVPSMGIFSAKEMEAVMRQRRQWEEEYLASIEAIVDRELTFYGKADGPITVEVA